VGGLTGHEESEPEDEDEEQDGPLLPLLREVPQRVRPLRTTRRFHHRNLRLPAADGEVRGRQRRWKGRPAWFSGRGRWAGDAVFKKKYFRETFTVRVTENAISLS
jgi:hypothetical protein